ncbi:MAG: hypothetical protein PHX68_03485 [Alphaproteobacteria bacterium]|nr:hypothetical protein [Alphaproteobacteria bacterium]
MKYICILLMVATAMPVCAQGRTAKGLTEAQQLGITAGSALACAAGPKLDDFELIASRIIANKAATDSEEQAGYRAYATSKFNTYQEQKKSPQAPCSEVLASFNRLPIFKSVVYADGSVKMFDGTKLIPKRPVKTPPKAQAAKKKPPQARAPSQKSKK